MEIELKDMRPGAPPENDTPPSSLTGGPNAYARMALLGAGMIMLGIGILCGLASAVEFGVGHCDTLTPITCHYILTAVAGVFIPFGLLVSCLSVCLT